MGKIHYAPPKDLAGLKFCRDMNNPHVYVTVLRICKAANGFQVLFKYGEDGHPVFCGYQKFIKYYPYELSL